RFRPRFDRVKQQVRDYQGFLFEEVCRQYLLRNVDRYEFQSIGRWWEREQEIDLVAIDEERSRFIFVECKYRNRPTDIGVLNNLKEKIEKVKWHKPFEIALRVIFSMSGFTDRLKALEKTEKDLELVTFEEMF
ncbi:MAG: DUF234 domain-containing protein, partial [bacterium]|nr:DUF234 domain-containing protein [bacterium]